MITTLILSINGYLPFAISIFVFFVFIIIGFVMVRNSIIEESIYIARIKPGVRLRKKSEYANPFIDNIIHYKVVDVKEGWAKIVNENNHKHIIMKPISYFEYFDYEIVDEDI